MFHKFVHSINLFLFNKSKNHCRNVQSIFGFFNPEILGKGTAPNLLFYFVQNIIQTKTNAFSFQVQQKNCIQPQTLTALKCP